MSDLPSESELIAYIDGALPPGRRASVDKEIAASRDLRIHLRSLIKLRATARSVMRESSPPVPDALRARIEAMMQVDTATPVVATQNAVKPITPKTSWFYPLWRPVLAAGVAACLAVGVWLYLPATSLPGGPPLRAIVQDATRAGLPPRLVSMVQARHLKCVMMGNNFEDPKFSHVLADVGPAVRQYLGDAVAIPDLTAINLQFNGVGPCQLDGGKTLHWLFRNPVNPQINVSVFVQPFSEQVAFDSKTAIVIAGPSERFPMLVWRDEKFVYYLIGDDFGAASQAAAKLGVGFGL